MISQLTPDGVWSGSTQPGVTVTISFREQGRSSFVHFSDPQEHIRTPSALCAVILLVKAPLAAYARTPRRSMASARKEETSGKGSSKIGLGGPRVGWLNRASCHRNASLAEHNKSP